MTRSVRWSRPAPVADERVDHEVASDDTGAPERPALPARHLTEFRLVHREHELDVHAVVDEMTCGRHARVAVPTSTCEHRRRTREDRTSASSAKLARRSPYLDQQDAEVLHMTRSISRISSALSYASSAAFTEGKS